MRKCALLVYAVAVIVAVGVVVLLIHVAKRDEERPLEARVQRIAGKESNVLERPAQNGVARTGTAIRGAILCGGPAVNMAD